MLDTYKGLLIVRNFRKKYGIFDKNLNIVIPFEYDNLFVGYELDNKFLFAVKNNQYGVVNLESGEFNINPELYFDYNDDPSEAIRKKGKTYGLIDKDGNFTVFPIYDSIKAWYHGYTYFDSYDDDNIPQIPQRYLIYKSGKVGVAGRYKVYTPPIYDLISLKEYTTLGRTYPAWVAQKNGLYGYIDNDGNPLCDFIYSEVDFPCRSVIGFGIRHDTENIDFINLKTKKIILNIPNNEYRSSSPLFNHLVTLTCDEKYRVYDENGKLLKEFGNNDKLNSAEVSYLNDKVLQYSGLYDKKQRKRFGLVDYSGNIITEAVYREIMPYNDSDILLGASVFGEKFEILNSNGEVIKSNLYAAGGSRYNEDGTWSLPIIYWNTEYCEDDFCVYPETEEPKKESQNAIWERFSDLEHKSIVFDNGDPYVYSYEKNELIVYDEFRNILKKIHFKISFFEYTLENFDF